MYLKTKESTIFHFPLVTTLQIATKEIFVFLINKVYAYANS
jgi:hypothetical protein